jgi:phosphate starvation-inducible PhoH-like protein
MSATHAGEGHGLAPADERAILPSWQRGQPGRRWSGMAEDRRLNLDFPDADALRTLCGERDAHFRWLEAELGVIVHARGQRVAVQGPDAAAVRAADVLHQAYADARAGRALDLDRLRGLLASDDAPRQAAKVRALPLQRPRPWNRAAEEPELGDGVRSVQARTAGQRRLLQAMREHEVVLAVGPAGTGKTFLAIAAALSALHRREVKRIVLTRPAVEAGERLGFLPGDLTEKVSPYLRPLYDALRDLMDPDRFERMQERGQIEVAPLAFMRGRTLANSFVILDEAQNCTPEQVQMLLTRMGHDARIVVTGDPSQSDLPRGQRSGLAHAVRVLTGVEGVGVVQLELADVVRHPLVGRIIAAYEADRQGEAVTGPTEERSRREGGLR